MPNEIETRRGTTVWDKHIYVDPRDSEVPRRFQFKLGAEDNQGRTRK